MQALLAWPHAAASPTLGHHKKFGGNPKILPEMP
jgi:hypothetical protein